MTGDKETRITEAIVEVAKNLPPSHRVTLQDLTTEVVLVSGLDVGTRTVSRLVDEHGLLKRSRPGSRRVLFWRAATDR